MAEVTRANGEVCDVYYRYEDYLQGTGGWDMQGEWEPGPSVIRIRVVEFKVLKVTPKGVWLKVFDGKRFVLNSAIKRFADPTLERALVSFRKRKERQASIYEARARNAREAIRRAEHGKLTTSLVGGYFI